MCQGQTRLLHTGAVLLPKSAAAILERDTSWCRVAVYALRAAGSENPQRYSEITNFGAAVYPFPNLNGPRGVYAASTLAPYVLDLRPLWK